MIRQLEAADGEYGEQTLHDKRQLRIDVIRRQGELRLRKVNLIVFKRKTYIVFLLILIDA